MSDRLYEKSILKNKFDCMACDCSTDTFSEIRDHLITYHVNECYRCKYCKELMVNYHEYRNHPKQCKMKPEKK
jgi:hypothetical protein